MIKDIKDFACRSRRTLHDANIADKFPEAYEDEKILLDILRSDFTLREKYLTTVNLMRPVFWSLSQRARGQTSNFEYPKNFEHVMRFVHSQPLDLLASKVPTNEWEDELAEAISLLTELLESGKITKYEAEPEFEKLLHRLSEARNRLSAKYPDLNESMDT